MARKPRTKKAMVAYLCDHFRYHTMSSRNNATSYAARVKLRDFIPHDIDNEAYEFLQLDEAFSEGKSIIGEFDRRWNYEWKIGSNGRSGGYLVLYRGGIQPPKNSYKKWCPNCHQGNFKEDAEVCGRCHREGLVNYPFVQTFTKPGLGTDMDFEDFESWDIDGLAARVEVVWDFDKTVEKVKQAFIDFVRAHSVVEKEIMVPKTIHVAVPNEKVMTQRVLKAEDLLYVGTSIIVIKRDGSCLGYLIHFDGKGTFCPGNGRVPVSKEDADVHNKALSEAELLGLDTNCKVGMKGSFYFTDGKVTTFGGAQVSEGHVNSSGFRRTTIYFNRKGMKFKGILRKDGDYFTAVRTE